MVLAAERRMIDQDRRIPGLALLLDGAALQGLLATTPGAGRLDTLEVDYLRYKAGENCIARIRAEVGPETVWGYAKAYGDNFQTKLGKAAERQDHGSPLGTGRFQFSQHGLEVNFLPNDNALPSVGRLADPDARDALLQRVFKNGPDWSGSACKVLNYKPERRLAVRFTHASGRRSVVKFSTAGRFRRSRVFHKKLVPVDGVLLPVMVGGSKAHFALAFDWRDGTTPGAETRCGNEGAGGAVGAALARFHQSLQPALAPLDLAAVGARLRALSEELESLVPDLVPAATRLADRMADWLAGISGACVSPVHGDFYPEQAVVGSAGTALIDCDQACLAPPLLDLGSYRARLAFEALTGSISRQREDSAAASLLGGYQAESDRADLAGLDRFTALGLFQLLHHPFRQRLADWPELTRSIFRQSERLWLRKGDT